MTNSRPHFILFNSLFIFSYFQFTVQISLYALSPLKIPYFKGRALPIWRRIDTPGTVCWDVGHSAHFYRHKKNTIQTEEQAQIASIFYWFVWLPTCWLFLVLAIYLCFLWIFICISVPVIQEDYLKCFVIKVSLLKNTQHF